MIETRSPLRPCAAFTATRRAAPEERPQTRWTHDCAPIPGMDLPARQSLFQAVFALGGAHKLGWSQTATWLPFGLLNRPSR